MAKIEFKGADEYIKKLREMDSRITGIIKYAVYPAAGIVADAVRANTPEDTGDLRDSLVLTDFKNEDGFIFTEIDFVGYDSKGVPNLLKARTLESGRHKKHKHPFVRPAVDRVKKAAELSIEMNLNKKLEEIMK